MFLVWAAEGKPYPSLIETVAWFAAENDSCQPDIGPALMRQQQQEQAVYEAGPPQHQQQRVGVDEPGPRQHQLDAGP